MISTAKKVLGLTMLFTILALNAAEVSNAVFERVNIKVVLVEPPEVRYGSSLPVSVGRRQPENRWVMIAVEYTPKAKEISRSRRRNKNDAFNRHEQLWLDNVTLKVRAMFDSIGNDGRRQYVLLDGATHFWTVRLDGAKHTALMFIPAYLIDRYYIQMPRKVRSQRGRRAGTSGVSVRKIKEDDLIVEAVFTAGNGELARGYCNIGLSNTARAKNKFDKMVGQIPGYLRFDGAVLSKGRSPWVFYNINHFDPEKVIAPKK